MSPAGANAPTHAWNEGRSVHIGLNAVDDDVYSHLLPPLASAENDARSMRDLANAAGFSTRVLLGDEATRENVLDTLEATIERLVAGDVLVITYSGHMTSVAGIGDDPDGWDEAWCLHDGVLLDDEFHDLLADVPAGADVIVVTDSCYASGMTDEPATVALPKALAARFSADEQDDADDEGRRFDAGGGFTEAQADGSFGDGSFAGGAGVGSPLFAVPVTGLSESLRVTAGVGEHAFVRSPALRFGGAEVARRVSAGQIPRGRSRAGDRRPIAAKVISLSAAGEGELAFEGMRHGLFTAALLEAVFESRDEPASYEELMGAVAARLPMQHPTIGVFGAAVPDDAASAAFAPQSAAASKAQTDGNGVFGKT